VGATVWVLYVLGVLLGGHFYSLFGGGEGLLSNVFGFCNLGSGLVYVVSMWLGVAVEDQARLETAEYGNIFLMVAGLVNYLLALDAFDLKVGRKR
jgi:TM2 domain-containing membrane protein YozV